MLLKVVRAVRDWDAERFLFSWFGYEDVLCTDSTKVFRGVWKPAEAVIEGVSIYRSMEPSLTLALGVLMLWCQTPWWATRSGSLWWNGEAGWHAYFWCWRVLMISSRYRYKPIMFEGKLVFGRDVAYSVASFLFCFVRLQRPSSRTRNSRLACHVAPEFISIIYVFFLLYSDRKVAIATLLWQCYWWWWRGNLKGMVEMMTIVIVSI